MKRSVTGSSGESLLLRWWGDRLSVNGRGSVIITDDGDENGRRRTGSRDGGRACCSQPGEAIHMAQRCRRKGNKVLIKTLHRLCLTSVRNGQRCLPGSGMWVVINWEHGCSCIARLNISTCVWPWEITISIKHVAFHRHSVHAWAGRRVSPWW